MVLEGFAFDVKSVSISQVIAWIEELLIAAWTTFKPGGKLHPEAFIEHKGHLVVEGLLLVVISYLLFQNGQKRPKTRKEERPLTEKEIDDLCAEWKPEPLAPEVKPAQKIEAERVITATTGATVEIDGKSIVSFASSDFVGLSTLQHGKEVCETTIHKYGVGSCGPRGFYGTIDVHLELESEIASFMGTEEAILYSYDIATFPSIIPAFANAKDLIICDEAVNYAIQNGCGLSRARVLTFKHNDVADLEAVLERIAAEDRAHRKPLNRRFIAVEGIYANTGKMAPLDKIMALKEKYKYRLIVDESLSLGVMGPNGRGLADHYGIKPGAVEIVGASLGTAVASIGGFCAGDREIVDHQRLSGLGYCFSASSPPYTAQVTIEALRELAAEGSELRARLASNTALFRKLAADIKGLEVVGGEDSAISPVVHLRLRPGAVTKEEYDDGDFLLERLSQAMVAKDGILIPLAKYSSLERNRPPPSLRALITVHHEPEHIKAAIKALTMRIQELQ